MIKIFHLYQPSEHYARLKVASIRDRIIAQLIDGIFLSAICSIIIFVFSEGKIYTLWVAPLIPQFLLEVTVGAQTQIDNFWWGGYFFLVHLPYGKDIFLHYPAPFLWIIYCLYYFLFTTFVSQTPGKMMKRLVILSTSKNALSVSTSFFRWIAYYVSILPFGLGLWWVGFGRNEKTWHDGLCKTQVYIF